MNSKFLTLTALSLSVIAVSACTNTAQDLPPGKYESSKKTTDSNGTNTSVEKTTNVGVDRYGNKTATVKTETTTDPEGLFNKSKTTTTKTVK